MSRDEYSSSSSSSQNEDEDEDEDEKDEEGGVGQEGTLNPNPWGRIAQGVSPLCTLTPDA